MNAIAVTLPHLPDGASIIVTGSTAALMPNTLNGDPGSEGYAWAKNVLIGCTEQMALHLSPRFIRVNCIHPTNVNTRLIHNEGICRSFAPDIENPPAIHHRRAGLDPPTWAPGVCEVMKGIRRSLAVAQREAAPALIR